MLTRLPIRILLPFLLLFSVNVNAKQDLEALVKELTAQIKSLQDQVAQSNARIDELEQKLTENVGGSAAVRSVEVQKSMPTNQSRVMELETADQSESNKPVVTAGDIKGTFKVPGTETSIGIGGFVKLDTLFSSTGMGQDGLGNQRLEVAEIPVVDIAPGQDDQITVHAKESRFWFKSFTPSQWGDINTYLEIDFYGDPRLGNYTPRLRHAYGSFGNFLAGQTWTTFLNSQALPNTLDNSNSVGSLLLLRQPQIRWTQPFSIGELDMDWQLAAEIPRTRIWDVANHSMVTSNASHYPDWIARLNLYPTWGNISVVALARHLQTTSSQGELEKSAWGGAVSVAGKINTMGADNVRFMLSYGDALGRYAANNFFEDGVINAVGGFDPVVSYGGMLAYQHWWTKAWRSTVAYGVTRADQPGFASMANRQSQSLHANLLWSPIMQTTIGLEYIYANRELVNGQNGELHRVQFSTRFNF